VAEVASRLWASPRTVEGISMFNREWDNTRAAHAAALDLGELAQAAALLEATSTHALYDVRSEYADWAERTVAEHHVPERAATRIYGHAANVAWVAGEFERAIDLASRGIAVAATAEGTGPDMCRSALCYGYLFTGRIDDARTAVPALEAAITRNEDPLATLGCAIALLVIATIVELDSVARYAEIAIDAAKHTGSAALLAQCEWFEGMRLRAGDPPDLAGALACFQRGVVQAREVGDRFEVVQNLMAIAAVSIKLELDTADASLAEAIAFAHELRYWPTVWTVVGYAAERLAATGRPYAAGVVAGYLEANQPHVVTLIQRSAIAYSARLTDVSGPEAEQGRADGAVMDRNRLVGYAPSMLSAPQPR
jgi:hypothetical protein